MRCVLIGNYGVGNFGDEAIREYFEANFNQVEWFVLSAHPTKTQLPRLPFGIRSLFTNWLQTLHAYYKADAIVYGGGTLFTDIESVQACLLWWWHAVPAILFRKPIILASQGIGPFKTNVGTWLAKSICKRAVFISVRDQLSFKRIENWPLKVAPVLTVDPVVLCVDTELKNATRGNAVGIIPRHNSSDSFLEEVKDLLASHLPNDVSIISFHAGSPKEQAVIQQLQLLAPNAIVTPVNTLPEAIHAIGSCTKILSHRFHGSLIARCLGVTLLTSTQAQGDKHSSLQASLVNIAAAKAKAKTAEGALKQCLNGIIVALP